MADLPKRLYAILHPNEALVASQLEPVGFGRHFATGSPKHFSGKVIFAEIQPGYRHPEMEIEQTLEACQHAGEDRPKRTKFVSSYRVVERIDPKAYRGLYLTTADGKVLELNQEEEKPRESVIAEPNRVRIFQHVAPLGLVVASNLASRAFGQYVTKNANKGAPTMFYTELDINVAELVDQSVDHNFHSPLPNVHGSHLRRSLAELIANPEKQTKTISLDSVLQELPYLRLKAGFWLATRDDQVFWRFPTHDELNRHAYDWLRSATM